MGRKSRLLAITVGIIVLSAVGFFLSYPYIPTEIAFGTEDVEARKKIEEITKAHGFDFHYDKNIRNETLVVISNITPRQYLEIDCEFFHWSKERHRRQGIIVYDREECAL